MENIQKSTPSEFEIDLSYLVKVLVQKKIHIFVITTLFILGGVITALLLPNKYTAYTIISPRSSEPTSGLSQFTARLGQLASSVGVDGFSSNSINSVIAIETLKSRKFLIEFVDMHNLAPILLATKGWDEGNQEWIYDSSIFNADKGAWNSEEAFVPTSHKKYAAFNKLLDISKHKDTGFYEISITTESPTTSHLWLTQLIDEINEYMRKRTLLESKKSIEYLTDQIEKSKLTEVKSLFYALLEREIQNQMLANAKQSYVFTVIDPSVVPEQKSSPNRLIIVLGATLAGLLAGVLFAAISHSRRSN